MTLLREAPSPYLTLTERHLHALWIEQIYFKPLQSVDGQSIKIHRTGTWNPRKGPAFSHACILIDGQPRIGTIELQITADEWFKEKHHQNPLYDSVILHLSLYPSSTKIFNSRGQGVLQICLENQLTLPVELLLRHIDLEKYPVKVESREGRCAREIFSKWPVEKIIQLLSSASSWSPHSLPDVDLDTWFFGEHTNKKLMSNAVLKKGALQLYQDYCTYYGKACSQCPFVPKAESRALFSWSKSDKTIN